MLIVETLEGDQRRVALAAAVVIALLVSAIVVPRLLTRPKTPFEQEQARAEASNPRWLKVEIDTSDGRREYGKSESIFVVVHYSSAAPHIYKADVVDGMSMSSSSDELHISNGQLRQLNTAGVVCCDTRLIGLDDDPFTRSALPPLKLAPGGYEIYLTSRRVFSWDTKGILTYLPSPFEVASNMLKIRVVPD